ncbi:hypothetical protein B188_13370 [Candidatus Brocadiaceae bacterium B188]|jgi:hypothetical protein|nr:hypothetical protein [Candidatus Brocadia sapporoensis]MEB2309398.1 hypothetical protein [Candidatus Brocadiaceae bacterium]OQZ01290.1 MAG: hypothetical protein B6D34_13755 [Candidatus Brocadia sp. UTAMX1]QQR66413.1 MAG: hypothetical protein IPI25_13005 [Candidatus Brocadia sp.]RZV58726.1 MAG: hypothetical protein EX330_05270 [Candidatus Brocadia sp. BROELEC01]TWU53370.1 hypothetical protein B188_13370 [Candidatus Brocadiaceae bacterium B188]
MRFIKKSAGISNQTRTNIKEVSVQKNPYCTSRAKRIRHTTGRATKTVIIMQRKTGECENNEEERNVLPV